MTKAETDAKYEADMAEYNKKLAEQKKQVEDFKRAEDEIARRKQEQKLAAEHAGRLSASAGGPRPDGAQPAA